MNLNLCVPVGNINIYTGEGFSACFCNRAQVKNIAYIPAKDGYIDFTYYKKQWDGSVSLCVVHNSF